MTDKRKVSYKPVSHTINTVKLESDYSELNIRNSFSTIDSNMRNNIFKHIRAIIDILKDKHRLTDEIKKELNIKLKEFNKYIEYIENINLSSSNFTKIQDLINNFKTDYYDAVGIKEKENNTAENGIGLFELFEVEKEVKKTNEQSMKSSSSASTETGSSTSSDNCKMEEIKETKSEDDTTLTTSDSSENEMKEKQSDPAEMAVYIEDNKESEKSKSGSCSSARSTSTSSYTEGELQEINKLLQFTEQNYATEWCINTKNIRKYLKSSYFDNKKFIEVFLIATIKCKDKYFSNTDQVKNFRVFVLGPIFSNYERMIKKETDKDTKYKQFVKSVINGIIESEELNLGKDVKKELQKVIKSEIKYRVNEIGEDLKSFGELDKTENDIDKTSSYSTKDEKNGIQEKIKITKEELFITMEHKTLDKIIIDIDQAKCKEYLKQEKYSKQALKDIILDNRFKENCLLINYNNEIKINDIFLKSFFIDPILNEYKKDHSNSNEIKKFIKTIFNVLTSDELKLMDEQKNELKKIKTDCLATNTIKKESKKTNQTTTPIVSTVTPRVQQSNNTALIEATELQNRIKKLTDVVDIIDGQLINKDDKQQAIKNTINLIKDQKSQLQNDKTKLQKAATLLILLEVYKVNIDKFIFFNEVYKKLNDTIKNTIEKKIKKQEIDLTQSNANLAEVIKEVNEVLTKQGKESIKDINITF